MTIYASKIIYSNEWANIVLSRLLLTPLVRVISCKIYSIYFKLLEITINIIKYNTSIYTGIVRTK